MANLIAKGETHPKSVTGTENKIRMEMNDPRASAASAPKTASAAIRKIGRDTRGINALRNAPQINIIYNVR